MTSSVGKYWIDITDLAAWNGFFTGTQRVTYEMAVRFYEHNPNAHFFAYNEKGQSFYEVDFGVINESILNSLKDKKEPVRRSGLHRPSPKAVVRTQSLRVYHNLPFGIKQRLTPARKDRLKQVYKIVGKAHRRVAGAKQQISKGALSSAAAIFFQPDDTVIILGKPWDTMTFIDVLRTQKLQQDFKIIHLIYDMIPTFLPHAFGRPLPKDYTSYMFEALSLTSHVIAISESTKNDVLKFCEEELLPTPSITVIRLGDTTTDPSLINKKHAVENIKPHDYILCVGTVEVRKNHILLYTAYKEAQARGLAMPKLVVVGGKGWYTNDVVYQFMHDPALKDSVTFLRNLSDKQVAWLYKNCLFTVYPSVYDGWGLPIAESLAYGKVCVASSTSSMQEISGNMLDYFSPYDSLGCMNAIQKHLDPKIRADKEALIKARYKSTEWGDTFHQIIAALR